MNERVLDASVLLAVLKNERLNDDVLSIIDGAVLSTVSLAEVLTRISDLGATGDPRITALFQLLSSIAPFTESQARSAALLRARTRHAGLSLGDRACLALALQLDADVYTADRAWAGINVGCPIHLVR